MPQLSGVHGTGSTACAWIVGLTADGHRVLVLDYENHPSEWSRRIRALGGIEATDRVIHVAPTGPAWRGPRGAIWQQQGELRKHATGATFVVVDSAAVACGGADSLKPEAPGQYFPALRYLRSALADARPRDQGRRPALPLRLGLLAQPRAGHLECREDRRGGHQVILSHRKGNNHEHQGKQLVTITWWEGLPAEVREETFNVKLALLIKAVLRAKGPCRWPRSWPLSTRTSTRATRASSPTACGRPCGEACAPSPRCSPSRTRSGRMSPELSCGLSRRPSEAPAPLSRIASRPCRRHAQARRAIGREAVATRTTRATRQSRPPM